MAEINAAVDKAYRTLRNHLHKVETMESLHVIWAYAVNIGHSKPFLNAIQAPDGFSEANYIQKVRWAAPWELETLAREVIINSELNLSSPKTFREANYFSGAINKLKDVDGVISQEYINAKNVMQEFARKTHRQFSWQVHGPNMADIARYFKIFGHPDASRLIESATGLSTQKIFGIGFVFWNQFTERFRIPFVKIDLPEIQQDDVALFEKYFSTDVEDLRLQLRTETQMNEKFNYAFHSLRRFPILKNPGKSGINLYCPIPDMIFRQITGGIYYLVKWTGLAGNTLGTAFEAYVGDVLEATELTPRYAILPEERFDGEKKTVDWIVSNEDEALFIECKTKRVTDTSKAELIIDGSTDKDLEDISDAVVQVYKTISDYRNNRYPSLRYVAKRKIYPLVVTMEEWFLMGNSLASVFEKVGAKMKALGLDSCWLDTMPFSICSIREFEQLSYVLKTESITVVIETKQKDAEMKSWSYEPYLRNKYQTLLSDRNELFPHIFKDILPISLGNTDF